MIKKVNKWNCGSKILSIVVASLLCIQVSACAKQEKEVEHIYYATFAYDPIDVVAMYDSDIYFAETNQRLCYVYDHVEQDKEIIRYDLSAHQPRRMQLEQMISESEANLEPSAALVASLRNELQTFEMEQSALLARMDVIAESDMREEIEERESIANILVEWENRITELRASLSVEELDYNTSKDLQDQLITELSFHQSLVESYRVPTDGYILSISCTQQGNQLYIGQMIPADAVRLRLRIANDEERKQYKENDAVMVKIDEQWYTSTVVNILENAIELEVSVEFERKVNFLNPLRVTIKKRNTRGTK